MPTIKLPLSESKTQKFTVKAIYEDGTPIKDIDARFIIPITDNYNLVFTTKVDVKKQCASFDIPPLSKFFNEGTTIKDAKLEVIADGQIYTPIKADIELYEPVKVSAEIAQEETKDTNIKENKVQAEIIDDQSSIKNRRETKTISRTIDEDRDFDELSQLINDLL